MRRLAIAAWAFAGLALAWFGLSGALTDLLSRPWTQLLIATDRFGAHPMCEFPQTSLDPAECLTFHQQDVGLLPGVGNGFPYLVAAVAGVALVVALASLRRTTVLGAPSLTPSGRAVSLVVAVLFGMTGVALLVEAIDGVTKNVQYYVLADSVAGLFAGAIAVTAVLGARRRTGERDRGERH